VNCFVAMMNLAGLNVAGEIPETGWRFPSAGRDDEWRGAPKIGRSVRNIAVSSKTGRMR